MYSPKSLILLGFGVFLPTALSAPTTVGPVCTSNGTLQRDMFPDSFLKKSIPSTAHCFGITYGSDEIQAAAVRDSSSQMATTHEFPMAYPLSKITYAWPNHGTTFAATGYPWAAGCDTGSLKKYPLVPAGITGRTSDGKANPWDGTTTRSSNVGNGHEQSDFLFLDGNNDFCLIATEMPFGTDGWLPCKW
ncbi:MAG: hypothetical protein Q9186_005706 [Xanthomendoza sp. 1 TL-2023]